MTYAMGVHSSLYITTAPPTRAIFGGRKWEMLAGKQLWAVRKYDETRDAYHITLCESLTDTAADLWVPAEWLEELTVEETMRREWRTESLSEATRQLKYAEAFRRLLWRELSGVAKKVAAGDLVHIKPFAAAVEKAFPRSWDPDHYASCWGQSGVVTREIREMGADHELHRAYVIDIPGYRANGSRFPMLWFLGEDLV